MIQCVCWPLCVAYLGPERFQKLLYELLCTFSRRPYARRTTTYTQAYRSIERSGREPVLQQSLPPWSLMISFEFRDLLSTDGGSANRFMTDLYVCIAAKASKSKAAARLSCDSTLAWDGVPVSIHAAGLELLGHSSASAHPVALEMLGHASASAPPAGLARPPSTLSFQDEAGNSGIAKPLPWTACEGLGRMLSRLQVLIRCPRIVVNASCIGNLALYSDTQAGNISQHVQAGHSDSKSAELISSTASSAPKNKSSSSSSSVAAPGGRILFLLAFFGQVAILRQRLMQIT